MGLRLLCLILDITRAEITPRKNDEMTDMCSDTVYEGMPMPEVEKGDRWGR